MKIEVIDTTDEDEIVGALFLAIMKAEGEPAAIEFLSSVTKYRGKLLKVLSPTIEIVKKS